MNPMTWQVFEADRFERTYVCSLSSPYAKPLSQSSRLRLREFLKRELVGTVWRRHQEWAAAEVVA
jgi:hypothetical protein